VAEVVEADAGHARALQTPVERVGEEAGMERATVHGRKHEVTAGQVNVAQQQVNTTT
jgi:hypothetical protein